MAKRFMQCCMGCLALAIAFGVVSTIVRAQSVPFRVIGLGIVVVGESVYALKTSSPPYGWTQLPDGSFDLPPVAPSTLINYSSGVLAITDSGVGWGKVGGVWTDLGPIPGTPVQDVSWGQVKAKYRR